MTMKPVLHSFAYGLDFLREQVADINEADMVKQPNGIMNHPAWTIGHITAATHLLARTIGVTKWLPTEWVQHYRTGSHPVTDAGIYDSKNDLLSKLSEAQSKITQAIEQMTDSQLDVPFPTESYRDVFPTIRHALTQVLIGHTAFHVGQISVWRKAMNLPPMKRSFE
ncbi:DinB family protein [bacterium]|nr:DinB family protein [bacterium]